MTDPSSVWWAPGWPNGGPKVGIEPGFGAELDAMARASVRENRERGGFLLGLALPDGHGWIVRIRHLIEVEGPAAADVFTFPAEAFLKMHHAHRTWSEDEVRAEPDVLRVVGWCHTHPGHGVFLSGADIDMHRVRFPLAFQVALVVDPTAAEPARRAGLVAWAGNGILTSHGRDNIVGFDPEQLPAGRAAHMPFDGASSTPPASSTAPVPSTEPTLSIAPPVHRSLLVEAVVLLTVLGGGMLIWGMMKP